jgi:sulfatase modifying factor 1
VLDPVVTTLALALGMLHVPVASSIDPGPRNDCPPDMRLVTGTHYDDVQHLCIDPRRDGKVTHCFAYEEGLTAEEGTVTNVRVCMDQFEAPNQKGKRPLVMHSFRSAQRWCAERKKRLCTEQEWELGCEGVERRPLAYGWAVDKNACNSDKGWRPFDVTALRAGGEEAQREVEKLWQGSASGKYLTCVSTYGIHDMMGNVEEWVSSRSSRKFAGALMGGFWAKPWTGCRGTNDAHEPTFEFYETGFRCCADPGSIANVTSANETDVPTTTKKKKKRK